MSSLISAIEAERMHQIKLLLVSTCIDTNYTDASGQTALFKACLMRKKCKSIMVTKLLINAKININKTDCMNRTALSYACISGNESIVKILLETGDMAPNTQDTEGYTNLMHAVLSGNMSVVAILLIFLNKYDLSLDERTPTGFTAYALAVKYGLFSIADLLQEKGASTETFDFELFRKSDEWRKWSLVKMNSRHRRVNTAPGALSKPLETTEDSIQSSLRVLKDKPKIQIYQNSDVLSTGISEAASLFMNSGAAARKIPIDDNTTKLPKLLNPSTQRDQQHGSSIRLGSSITTKSSSTQHRQTSNSSKEILGALLHESALSKAQLKEDKKRCENIQLFKSQQRFSMLYNRKFINNNLPRIETGDAEGDDGYSIRRCYSSEPTPLNRKLSASPFSARSRRVSLTH